MTNYTDPFSVPMVFLRIGWMESYKGFVQGDSIEGGGGFVADNGYGHEIFNFSPYLGHVYGYVQPPRGGHNRSGLAKIHVEKIGTATEEGTANGVLAIWVATSPQGGAYVIGWYRNATIYNDWQQPPDGSGRDHAGQGFGYYVTARSDDAVLLIPDERVFRIPQGSKGEMGQSNVWYANDPESHGELRQEVLRYIETRRRVIVGPNDPDAHSKQPDPLLRRRVEEAAVRVVQEYYSNLGYRVDSVERDNVGWDLNATLGSRDLKLEVKGLSGTEAESELTPNEYSMMKNHVDSYRLCVVMQALTSPDLQIFAYSNESSRWESQHRIPLRFSEIIAARFSAKPE